MAHHSSLHILHPTPRSHEVQFHLLFRFWWVGLSPGWAPSINLRLSAQRDGLYRPFLARLGMVYACFMLYIHYISIYIYMQYIICFSWFPHDACGWIESKPTGSPGSVSAFSEKKHWPSLGCNALGQFALNSLKLSSNGPQKRDISTLQIRSKEIIKIHVVLRNVVNVLWMLWVESGRAGNLQVTWSQFRHWLQDGHWWTTVLWKRGRTAYLSVPGKAPWWQTNLAPSNHILDLVSGVQYGAIWCNSCFKYVYINIL